MLLVGLLNINQRNYRSYPTKSKQSSTWNNQNPAIITWHLTVLNSLIAKLADWSWLFFQVLRLLSIQVTFKQEKEIVELKNYLTRIGYSKSNMCSSTSWLLHATVDTVLVE
jgi:hypothetical protein